MAVGIQTKMCLQFPFVWSMLKFQMFWREKLLLGGVGQISGVIGTLTRPGDAGWMDGVGTGDHQYGQPNPTPV